MALIDLLDAGLPQPFHLLKNPTKTKPKNHKEFPPNPIASLERNKGGGGRNKTSHAPRREEPKRTMGRGEERKESSQFCRKK